MCVRVRFASSIALPYDAERRVVTVPVGLAPDRTLLAVRAVLDELGAEQPAGGARCWCGDAVHLWDGQVPAQRQGEVIKSGA